MRFLSKVFKDNKDYSYQSVTEVEQIPSVFNSVFDSNKLYAKECAENIYTLLSAQILSKRMSFYDSFRKIELAKNSLNKFHVFGNEIGASLFCVATMNSNGYVREEALKCLSKSVNKHTFPFVLYRLSDWVPRVRELAKKIIRKMIEDKQCDFLVLHHKIIDWLPFVKRDDLSVIQKEIVNFIFSEGNTHKLLEEVYEYSDENRYFVFKNLIKRACVETSVLEKILNDKNHLIRLLAVRNLRLVDKEEIVKRLLKDKSQVIRHYAIEIVTKDKVNVFWKELQELIFDNSAIIRRLSRDLLSFHKTQNYVQIYRNRVSLKPNLGSIVGLSEVGNLSDIETFEALLKSANSKIIVASIVALSNLDYALAKNYCFEKLKDSSNTVKKICLNVIPRNHDSGDLTQLRAMYDRGDNDTKRFVLKTIKQYGGWGIAGDFLKGIQEPDNKLKALSCSLLSSWFNYSVRLGTKQTEEEKKYVLHIYRNMKINSLDLSYETKKMGNKIPFIFK